MKRFVWIAVLLYGTLLNTLYGQPKSTPINGRITSFEESLPLEGVSIVVKGTRNGTGTQADGTFTLAVQPEDSVLQISYAGYEKQEVKLVPGKRDYDIILKRSSQELPEIETMRHEMQSRGKADIDITFWKKEEK